MVPATMFELMRRSPVLILAIAFFTLHEETIANEFSLVQSEGAISVSLNDRLFTRYVIKSGSRPILWPVVGPTGVEMTRAFPMREGSSDSTDHLHHRSLWFGHGDVNGINFWHEENPFGTIRHEEFLKIENGPVAQIITRNTWVSDENEKVCSDYRSIQFGCDKTTRWIDFDITIVNDTEEPVIFGDTKEGCFALRVTDSIRAEGDNPGRIINAAEDVDKDAWGKPAAWVDYQGPDAQNQSLVGVAILNHPASFRFPTYWHVRTYGLFAANVFGLHNFKNSNEEDGSHTIEPGESISFFYRVVIHAGDERKARIPEAFVDYATLVKVPVPKLMEVEEPATPDSDIVAIEETDESEAESEKESAEATETDASDTKTESTSESATAPVLRS